MPALSAPGRTASRQGCLAVLPAPLPCSPCCELSSCCLWERSKPQPGRGVEREAFITPSDLISQYSPFLTANCSRAHLLSQMGTASTLRLAFRFPFNEMKSFRPELWQLVPALGGSWSLPWEVPAHAGKVPSASLPCESSVHIALCGSAAGTSPWHPREPPYSSCLPCIPQHVPYGSLSPRTAGWHQGFAGAALVCHAAVSWRVSHGRMD